MKKIIKEFLMLTITIILVSMLFASYLSLVGIPKTQARNYYNSALIEISSGNKQNAIELLQVAKQHWNEKYIEEKLSELNP